MDQGTLRSWIIHRSRTVRLSWPHGVADAAGIAPATLDSVADSGSLLHVGRSARSYIARALKVSVRELEALDSGRIQWIADERIVDLDRLSINAVRPPAPAAPIAIACPMRRGIAILGQILDTGKVEHFDDWTPEDGARLPVRYAGAPDAFALALTMDFPPYTAGDCLVFQVIPPGELLDGELALLTHGQRDVESELCIVRRVGQTLFRCSSGDGDAAWIAIGDIPRAARVIGHHAAR